MFMNSFNIDELDYSKLVSIVKERNRPSGGIKTVHEVAVNAFVDSSKKMLEIGSNTGFTSVNMSLLTDCDVTGIDINQESVDESIAYAKRNGVERRTKFQVASATKIPFDDNYFDIVWSSNVTSFIDDKTAAIREYLRVLKMGGILVVVPIYYHSEPPVDVIRSVSEAIGAEVKVRDEKFWIDQIQKSASQDENFVELIYKSSYRYDNKSVNVSSYVDEIFKKGHLSAYSNEEKIMLRNRYAKYMNLFNTNLQYAQYSVLLFQKRNEAEEVELFTTKKNNY